MPDKILVRLRGQKPVFKILFEGDDLPDIGLEAPSDLDTALLYSPKDTDESVSLYYVELDAEQKNKMIDPYLEADSFGADKVVQTDYYLVNAIYQKSGKRLAISRVNPAARIKENGKTMIAFNEKGAEVNRLSHMIDFSGAVDAYYDGSNRIYFEKYSKAKSLFKDFDEFFQEAWYDDKELFLEHELFDVSEIEPEDIGTSLTNKIAEIQGNPKLDLTDVKTINKIHDYVKKYPLSGVIINPDGRIKMRTRDDLECTINLLTQRYYTSEITGDALQARGSEKMKNQKAKKVFNGVEVDNKPDK